MDGRVVSSDVVRTHHGTRHTTPIHNLVSTAPQFSTSQKALGTLPDDGNVMPKHVGYTIIINKLNQQLVYLLVFHAYINKMHDSRSKIPSKKSRPYIHDKFLALLGAPYIYIYIQH
jgi:hypothetical protein